MNNTQDHINSICVSEQDYLILSTKLLPETERKRLAESGLLLKEVPFIKKKYRSLNLPDLKDTKAIFTSVQAVKALQFNNFDFSKIATAFCVGGRTVNVLNRLGVEVAVSAKNARELGSKIAGEYRKEHFMAFSGNLRRDELFEIMAQSHVEVEEIVVYDTIIHKRLLDKQFGRILFFSPSGVKSYVFGGNNTHADVYCLGSTTAEEAGRHFNRVHIAPKPTINSLVEYVINDIKNHEQNQKIKK